MSLEALRHDIWLAKETELSYLISAEFIPFACVHVLVISVLVISFYCAWRYGCTCAFVFFQVPSVREGLHYNRPEGCEDLLLLIRTVCLAPGIES
jgi:hypothetical protein